MRYLGLCFDHMHMGDLLRLVADTPGCSIAGIYDPDIRKLLTWYNILQAKDMLDFSEPTVAAEEGEA